MLRAFHSNDIVKAFIFMPGATDELYMFRRAKAVLTNSSPTLLDAVTALTNQTIIHATFRPPLFLLHTVEDVTEPLIRIESESAAGKVRKARGLARIDANDKDWDTVEPLLRNALRADIRPWKGSVDSWHFYRHSLAAWNLTGWETLEAIALAGKTTLTIRRTRVLHRPQVVFEPDRRYNPAGGTPLLPDLSSPRGY